MNPARKAPWAALAGGALLLSLVSALPASASTPGQAAVPAVKPSPSPSAKAKKKAAPVDCAKVKCIALTFDDGPGKYAGKLLDTLKKHKAKATFFLEGQYAKSRPQFVKRMADEGHQLGNHSYSHPDFTLMLDETLIQDEIQRTQDVVKKITGKNPTLLRPPYGLTDYRVEAIAAELGMPIALWNAGSRDWATRDKKAIHDEVMRNAKRDAVVLMHDWVQQTVETMPTLLTSLKKQGYHVVTVDSLLRGKPLKPGQVYPPDARTVERERVVPEEEIMADAGAEP